ncbi:Mitochondrial rotenone-insensitive NADH dehydrogenase (NDE2 external NADH dehydrogenase) [Balamuthia mandrillaris]
MSFKATTAGALSTFPKPLPLSSFAPFFSAARAKRPYHLSSFLKQQAWTPSPSSAAASTKEPLSAVIPKSSELTSASLEPPKNKLVILGTGWAGFRALRDIDTNLYHVNVISPRNHFLFTPLLTATTVGTLEFRGVIEPVRAAARQVNYVQAYCTGIDPENKQVHFESAYDWKDSEETASYRPKATMRYDKLVVAVGSVPNTFGIPGVEKYCFFLRELEHARKIRQRIIECFERASSRMTSEEEQRRLLHFVVVGGGPTSVEFTAELYDFLKQDVHKWFPDLEDKVVVTLLEASNQILGSFDQKLSQYTMRLFQKRKIDLRTGVTVKEVRRHEFVLANGDTIPFGLAVWSTGVAPSPLVRSLASPPFKKHTSGRLMIDEKLRVVGTNGPLDDVYAAGDDATFENQPLPPTAQVAEQQGKYLAYALNEIAKGKQPRDFRYKHRGMLAYIGGKQALVDNPILKKIGFGTGFGSWLFWNGAYLTKLVSLRNKIMIPLYWFKSFVFGRDISRF